MLCAFGWNKEKLLSARLRGVESFNIKFQNKYRKQLFLHTVFTATWFDPSGSSSEWLLEHIKRSTHTALLQIYLQWWPRGAEKVVVKTLCIKKMCSMSMCVFFFFYSPTHNGLQNFLIARSLLAHGATRREVPVSILGMVLGNFKWHIPAVRI